ncbi:MAG: hypothetical protein M3R17_20435 [Bacteroidota bacterium]|nr:hypothetical protein [Bacteroidota bacterium]
MKNSIFTPRLIFITLAVVAAALTRFLPHPPNFTAIGGIALFAGAFIPNRVLSLLIPMAVMVITDAVIGFHNTMWAVYLSFALITTLGWLMQERKSAAGFVATSFIASVLFFFITNAAMWIVGFWESAPLYSRNAAGLGEAIALGLPFYSWNFLISQFVYGGILFGLFYTVKVWKPSLVKA